MKIKDIDFSLYTYNRVCVLGRTRVHFPPGTENTLIREYGDCYLIGEPEIHDSGWMVLNVEY